ncbi:MAG TPA: hypothetical protein VIG97_11315 [Luteimonas sp.]
MIGRIVSFIVHGPDYFAAKLDNGRVRVGLTHCDCFDLQPEHPRFAEALALATPEAVESMHDDLMGASLARGAL